MKNKKIKIIVEVKNLKYQFAKDKIAVDNLSYEIEYLDLLDQMVQVNLQQ